MLRRELKVLVLGLSIAATCRMVQAADVEPLQVRFSAWRTAEGAGQEITGQLFLPAGKPPAGGFPAVVALHGCGGMYSTLPEKTDALNARHQAMAEMLVGEGYAVLFPDSLRPRGERELCTQKLRERSVTQSDRRADAHGALAYLRHRPDIAGDRIALLGWSHGGSTVLATLNGQQPAVASFVEAQGKRQARASPPANTKAAERKGGAPESFAVGIAFYPGCSASVKAPEGFLPISPVTILMGDADDWTPPAPCRELAEKVKAAPISAGRGSLELVLYPGAYHDFDNPRLREKRVRAEVPNGIRPGDGVTVAPDPKAREDAYRRVREILRAALQPAKPVGKAAE